MITYTSSPIRAHLADQEPATNNKPELEDFWKFETLGISEPVSVNDDKGR